MDENKIVKTDEVAPANAIKLGKKHRGIESLKSTYGRLFVLHWEIGLILFFVVPLIKSLYFAFCDLSFGDEGYEYQFAGLTHFKYAINEDPEYVDRLLGTLASSAGSLPVIVILSLILALLLNQKFKGRLFFRALYFLPVIIASGVVITHLFSSTSSELSSSGVSDSFASNMITADEILGWLSLPPKVIEGFSGLLNNIFNLVWNCGIQIVLFISGMQSIPDSLYEVSKVEGATKWEEFWFITLPMLSRTLILVIIFTMVELVTDKNNDIMSLAYQLMQHGATNFGKASAMLWIYFGIVSVIMALLMFAYNALFLKRWDTGGRS
ncbi:MAG: sugar ABC transporter permease [Ruminococcaceae bacterium]|nr:sugar ABC transporter permease [Oscillospiraceae bacterium]